MSAKKKCTWNRCRNIQQCRRKSDSYDWVCLSLIDASTGMLGPPVTCPLPEGAGYRTVLVRDGSVFCQSKKKHSCPIGYECIKSISLINSQGDGVCCPRRGLPIIFIC